VSTIELRDGGVVVRLTWAERILSASRDVAAGRHHIAGVRETPRALDEVTGLRSPGLGLPGHAMIGTWRRFGADAGRDFVVVRGRGHGVVIELVDHTYDRFVLSVEDPSEVRTGLGR